MSTYVMNPPIATGMPPPVSEVFVWCHAQHCRLRRMCRMCHQLWGAGSQTVHLLNQTAPLFFSDVRGAFFDDMHMSIARLTDPVRSAGKRTLGFRSLVALVKADQPNEMSLHQDLDKLFADAEILAKNIRDKRNTMLAHNDHAVLTGKQTVFLNAGTDTFEAIFVSFEGILNRVQETYGGLAIPVDFLEVGADADRLISALTKRG